MVHRGRGRAECRSLVSGLTRSRVESRRSESGGRPDRRERGGGDEVRRDDADLRSLWLLFILIAFYGQTIRIRSFPAATYGDNLASSEGRLDFDQSLHLDGRVQRQRVGADGTACVIAAVLEDRHHHVRAAVEHEVLLLKFLL